MLASLLPRLGFPHSKVVDLPRSECIFCRIADGNHRDSKSMVFEDELAVVFPDIEPAGLAHFQVVTKQHILNVAALQPGEEHYRLATHLLQTGQSVCEQQHPGAPTRFGFHVPPFNSISHLHMHAIVLPHKTWWSAWKYFPGCPWWLPADQLVAQLRPSEVAATQPE